MKLHLHASGAQNIIQRYDNHVIRVNNQEYRQSLIISAENILAPWRPRSVSQLQASDWQVCFDLPIDLILLGTGNNMHFPAADITLPLLQRHIGIECMTSAAACRTYNVIVGDGRRVAAAIIIEAD